MRVQRSLKSKADGCTHADAQTKAHAVAAAVRDPELPFLTLADLGILREVTIEHDVVVAKVTPTYTGCPAVLAIEHAVGAALRDAGFVARVERVVSPPWTTDWITPAGREKLKAHGIAPPTVAGDLANVVLFAKTEVQCPHCNSNDTQRVSQFGSTPCKAQYRCLACEEPFDYFKCL